LQQPVPDDYVCATGETHTVREFCDVAFRTVGMELVFEGHGQEEIGRDVASGRIVIAVSPSYFRPTEVDLLLGDPAKARKVLGWEPKVTFADLAALMAESDWKEAQREKLGGTARSGN
jgi:GDPmannose 4,6-dehydratase